MITSTLPAQDPRALRLVALLLLAQAFAANAQTATVASPAPHPLGPIIATSTATFSDIAAVRQLSDGRLLVQDPSARTVTALDPGLAHPTVVLDSAGGRNNSYGSRLGRLMPFFGDSSLFYDGESNALLVLDPTPRVARVFASPAAASPLFPAGGPGSFGGALNATQTAIVGASMVFSPTLGLVYAKTPGIAISRFSGRLIGDSTNVMRLDDSATVLAINLATRATDTLGSRLIGMARVESRTASVLDTQGAFALSDGWTVTTDGSVALVRTREYRIDWVNPDRTRTAGPRMPYPWHALSDEEKTRLMDSVNAVRAKAFDVTLAPWLRDSAALAQGKPISAASGRLPARPRPGRSLEIADVPDYAPSFANGPGGMLADGDNNLWIVPRPLSATPESPTIYDVMNRQSRIVDRVSIPTGQRVIGFGPGGIAYLVVHEAGRVRLAKARIR